MLITESVLKSSNLIRLRTRDHTVTTIQRTLTTVFRHKIDILSVNWCKRNVLREILPHLGEKKINSHHTHKRYICAWIVCMV